MSRNKSNQNNPIEWVMLAKYCDLSGETQSAIYTRRNKGIWIDGVHVKTGRNGRLWVNLEEAQRWAIQ